MYCWYATGSPAVKRELFMTTKGCPTGQHTPQNTLAHGITTHTNLHQHFDTHMNPAACTKLQTTFSIGFGTAKMAPMAPKKAQKCRAVVSVQARVRRGGGDPEMK